MQVAVAKDTASNTYLKFIFVVQKCKVTIDSVVAQLTCYR